jgi:hypothetical protein
MGYTAKNPIITISYSQQNTIEAIMPSNSLIVRVESRNSITIQNPHIAAAWLIAKLATI